MMFRRRTTDQVYATLQQVQRRITEQGGGNAPTGSAPPAGARPLGGIAPPPLQTNQHLSPAPYAPLPAAPAMRPSAFPGGPDDGAAPPARGTLQISMQIGLVLVLLWFGTLAAAYFLGERQGNRKNSDSVENRPAAGETPPTKPQDPETPAPGKRQGDSIFVLTSTPTFTPALKQQWQAEVDRLNGVMKQNEAKGWKPYFALREPENGGLQFVFGQANGRFGIDRAQFEDLARQLAAPKAKGGGGYASAKWLAVD
jgi:hypothetical protein